MRRGRKESGLMDGFNMEMRTLGDIGPPHAVPHAAIAAFYVAFLAALFVAHGLRPAPAQIASAGLMALSAAAWLIAALYERAWEANHRRNSHGIQVAGAPELE